VGVRKILETSGPPLHPFDFDRFCANLQSAIEALGTPSELELAGLPLPALHSELQGLSHLTEPLSPALLSQRTENHLGFYAAFSRNLSDWRTNGLRILQAALLYFSCRPDDGKHTGILSLHASLEALIDKTVETENEIRFEFAEFIGRCPRRIELGNWAELVRRISDSQPQVHRSSYVDLFRQVAAAIDDLPEAERCRTINVADPRNLDDRHPAETLGAERRTKRDAKAPRLQADAQELLTACGVHSVGRLDLALFASRATAVLVDASEVEKESAHWARLQDAILQIEKVIPHLPPLSEDYQSWWCRESPVLYRSVLALRQVDGDLMQPSAMASLCLRAALVSPDTANIAKHDWVDAKDTLNGLAHEVIQSANHDPESRLGPLVACVPKGLATKASIRKLRALATNEPGLASEVAAVLLVLDGIADAAKTKAVARNSLSGPIIGNPIRQAEGQATPTARQFFSRIHVDQASVSDLQKIGLTLSDLRLLAGGHAEGGSVLVLLDDVVAALSQPGIAGELTPSTRTDSANGSPVRDALKLQPVSDHARGIRTLQLILFQHVCAPPRKRRGRSTFTTDLDAPLAELILTIHQMQDLDLLGEAHAYLDRVPAIPSDNESFEHLWNRSYRRVLATSDVSAIAKVLESIQRDRQTSPPAPSELDVALRENNQAPDSSRQPSSSEERQRPHCSPTPRRSTIKRRTPISSDISASGTEPRATTTGLRGPVRRPTTEELERIRQNGETIEEIVGETEAAIIESAPRTVGNAQLRVFAARQISALRQGVWARHQWDALTTEESAAFVAWLLLEFDTNWLGSDYVRREAIAICLMMSTTSFSIPRLHAIAMGTPLDSDVDSWIPERGALSFPVPGTEARFKPSAEQLVYLEPVGDRTHLLLPKEVVGVLQKLEVSSDPYLFACDLDSLTKSVTELVEQARECNPRLTLARLQRSQQLEVLNQTGDLALAQLICGDTLRVAPTPLSYYGARTESIQRGYNKAIQRFGLTPQIDDTLTSGRVGSKLLATKAELSKFVKHTQRGLVQAPRSARTEGRAATQLHQAIVPSLATLFLAATSHRPTFRIGLMTANNLCLPAGIAVIEDKVSDEQHEARLVPLCPLVKRSLAAYGKHLKQLTRNESLIDSHRKAASDALSGDGPLFFLFDGAGTRPLAISDLNDRAPPGWNLPKNFLRHHLATALRDEGCPGVYVQALMGHLESGIQPFGAESFMSPPEYLEQTASQIEAMLKTDGWRPFLGGSEEYDVFARHMPPLLRKVIGIQGRHARARLAQHRKQRRYVDHVRAESKDEIEIRVKAVIDEALTADCRPSDDAPTEINADILSKMRKVLCAEADDLAHAEISIQVLRSQLKEGRADGRWKVKRLPSFFVPRPLPAVFSPSYVPLFSSIHRLRQLLLNEIIANPNTDPQGVARRCILALILWHGVCDKERLHQLLKGIPRAECAQRLDALVVPIELVETATGRTKLSSDVLRGVVAILARAAEGSLQAGIADDQVGLLLRNWIPTELIDCPGKNLLGVLFEAASAAHRFESIGPVREVWTGTYTSVSLPPERLLSLLDSRPSTSVAALQLPVEQPSARRQESDHEPSGEGRKQPPGYKWLKDVLRYRNGRTKTFPSLSPDEDPTEETKRQPPESFRLQDERDIRREMVRRLDERLNQWPADGSLLRALFAYALDCLLHGTPWNSRVGMPTIYQYVLGAGTPMLAQHDGLPLDQMDGEDFHELYEACVEGSKYEVPAKQARFLAYFHGFLATKLGAPGVAIGDSTKGLRCFPDVGYVTPREYLLAGQMIDDCLTTAQAAEGSIAELKTAAVAIPLGFATGARTSEVLLRDADELAYDHGSRALLVRRNRFSTVKTLRATRRISIESVVCDSGWRQIEFWRDDVAVLRPKGAKSSTALFPDWSSGRPIDPDRLTKLIGETLRGATGLDEARPYWWRHTLTSNEFLTQLGGSDVLEVLVPTGDDASLGLGANGESLGYPPEDVPPCQAHAANFRARRGHWRMRTSVETYIHLVALIEPHASRQASLSLSVDQLGRLAGLSPDVTRKRLARAGIRAAHRTQVIQALLGESKEQTNIESGTPAPGSPKPLAREVKLPTIISAIVSAVRAGDVALAGRALHMTRADSARWEAALRAAVDLNLYGVELPGTHETPVESATLRVVRRKRKHSLHVQRVDTKWLIHCVERALVEPQLLDAWRVVLRGLDLASGCIAVSSHEELATVLGNLPRGVNISEENPSLAIELVAKSADTVPVGEVSINAGATPLKDPINTNNRFQPPLGCLTIGAIVKDLGRRRALNSTLLLAAVLVCAACQIKAPAHSPTTVH